MAVGGMSSYDCIFNTQNHVYSQFRTITVDILFILCKYSQKMDWEHFCLASVSVQA